MEPWGEPFLDPLHGHQAQGSLICNAATVPQQAPAFLLILIYLGFVSLGFPDGALGAAWPQMRAGLGLPVGLAGILTMVATLLSAASSLSSTAIIKRGRTGVVVLVSGCLTGGALVMIARAPSFVWLVVAAVPLGLGAGAVDASLNGYVARHYSGRHMNWLHACWGIGATAGPLVMTQAVRSPDGWRGGYLALGAAQLMLALIFLVTLRLWDTAETSRPTTTQATTGTNPPNSEAGWLSPLIFAVYVGVELMVGLWGASLLVESRGVAPAAAGLASSAYYGAITIGRIMVGTVVNRWGNRRMVRLGLGIALLGAALLFRANTAALGTAALLLIGLGLAPVYPCLMHEVPRRFTPDGGLVVVARQSSAAYLGCALLPAAIGWLAQRRSLETLPVAVIAGLLCLLLVVGRLDRVS
ncbi:MAG: hypothetical protein QOI66_2832 [Myxococcales bacterium]|nr:hypothetical protein [Myxococcales bacterium]